MKKIIVYESRDEIYKEIDAGQLTIGSCIYVKAHKGNVINKAIIGYDKIEKDYYFQF